MPILYNLDLKDYIENAAVTKCAAVKVIIVSSNGILLGNGLKQGFYEVPSKKVQPVIGGLREHAVQLVRELLSIDVDVELPVIIGQAFYKRKNQEDPDAVINELYNYIVVDLKRSESAKAGLKAANDDYCFIPCDDVFMDKENNPGLPELAYTETAAIKKAMEYVNGECGDIPRVIPKYVSIDEPMRR